MSRMEWALASELDFLPKAPVVHSEKEGLGARVPGGSKFLRFGGTTGLIMPEDLLTEFCKPWQHTQKTCGNVKTYNETVCPS